MDFRSIKQFLPRSSSKSRVFSNLKDRVISSSIIKRETIKTSNLNGPNRYSINSSIYFHWRFDIRILNAPHERLHAARDIMYLFDVHGKLGISSEKLFFFLNEVQMAYEPCIRLEVKRPYHNFLHAVNVLQTLASILNTIQSQQYVDWMYQPAVLVAALCHDVGHPGVSSQYLVNADHELARSYATPVLEQMHAAITLKLLDKCQLIHNIAPEDQDLFKRIVARSILHTDMRKHEELLCSASNLNIAIRNSVAVPLNEQEQLLLCGFLLYVSDVSNPAKEWNVHRFWSKLIFAEFFEQGKLEKSEGLVVSPNCDPELVCCGDLQVKFIELVTLPTFKLLSSIFPQTSGFVDIIQVNRKHWINHQTYSLSTTQMSLIRWMTDPVNLNKLKHAKRRSWCSYQVNGFLIAFIMTFSTLYALFADDIRIALFSPEVDEIFEILTLTVFTIFMLELCFSVYMYKGYFRTMYFWIDLISALFSLLDVSYFRQMFALNGEIDPEFMRSAKSIRAGRSIRMFRLLRLFQIFRAYYVEMQNHKRELEQDEYLMKPLVTSKQFTYLVNETESLNRDEKKTLNLEKIQAKEIAVLVRESYNGMPPPLQSTPALIQYLRVYLDIPSHETFQISLSKFENALRDAYQCTKEIGMKRKPSIDWSSNQIWNQSNSTNSGVSLAKRLTERSKIGKELTELTIKRVIILVLILLLVIPLLIDPSETKNETQDYGLKLMHRTMLNHYNTTAINATNIQENVHIKRQILTYLSSTSPIYMKLHNVDPELLIDYSTKRMHENTSFLSEYRREELSIVSLWTCSWQQPHSIQVQKEMPLLHEEEGVNSEHGSCLSVAVFDESKKERDEAMFRIVQTWFLFLCLMLGSIGFTKDISRIVITPVERMVSMVKKLALNPLSELKASSRETSKKTKEIFEIQLLENTLQKITSLVQVGLGEAGASLISQTMSSGSFNPLIPGTKRYAIFGFCKINHFSQIVELLSEEVMIFTNTITDIVHNVAHCNSGMVNKSTGEAYLIVWKLPNDSKAIPHIQQGRPPEHLAPKTQFTYFDQQVSIRRASQAGNETIADKALKAFARTFDGISKSQKLQYYEKHPKLVESFPNGFKVELTFGLHIGWAIEGAIGSRHKIDASYLAPDVNMASRLEAATKQYGVSLLMSHSFFNRLSPNMQLYCRCIDCVTVKGSTTPIGLFSYDIQSYFGKMTNLKEGMDHERGKINPFSTVPFHVSNLYRDAIDKYFGGNWSQAKEILEQLLLESIPDDGPSRNILEFMRSHSFQAPEGWKGYRKLVSK